MVKTITISTPKHSAMLNAMKAEFHSKCRGDLYVYDLLDSYEGEFGTSDFFEVMLFKVRSIIDSLKQLTNDDYMIYLDGDIHIRRDIVTEMTKEIRRKGADIMLQSDDGYPCAGMFICKCGDKMLNLFLNVLDLLLNNREHYTALNTDQTALYDAMINPKNEISYRFLSRRFTTYGNLRRDKNAQWHIGSERFRLPPDLVAFHANFTVGIENKEALLKIVRNVK